MFKGRRVRFPTKFVEYDGEAKEKKAKSKKLKRKKGRGAR